MTQPTIRIRYRDENGDEHELTASGLGDLGWQLDAMGCDSAADDSRFTVLCVDLAERE